MHNAGASCRNGGRAFANLAKHWRGGHELFAADPIALEPGEGGGSFLLLTFSILIRPV